MNILVTGGAGYIGSHAVKQLINSSNNQVVVIDDLRRGHRRSVPEDIPLYRVDIAETSRVVEVIQQHQIDTVMHFAALAYVGESVEKPLQYYRNNTAGTISLLHAMQQTGVNRLIFSSTCAAYGSAQELPLVESSEKKPINPYGWSKLFVEQIVTDLVRRNQQFAAFGFRYFNVAGAAADGSLGEMHNPETHVIPLLLQVAAGRREYFTIYGDDYKTPDGTCVRDYLHVDDVCAAHLLALHHLEPGNCFLYNLGTGKGYSIWEAIQAVERVTGVQITVRIGDRRPGDPDVLYASSELAEKYLGWKPQYIELEAIIRSAWNWYSQQIEQ